MKETCSMAERFFSVRYAGQGEIFESLEIWREERYRQLQGTYPVISLSFATVKGTKDFWGSYEEHKNFVNGYWNELAAFMRNLSDAGFKTNVCLERAIMTGITRISKESIFGAAG